MKRVKLALLITHEVISKVIKDEKSRCFNHRWRFCWRLCCSGVGKNGIETLLVDKKNYFEVTFATLRNMVAPEVTKNDAKN